MNNGAFAGPSVWSIASSALIICVCVQRSINFSNPEVMCLLLFPSLAFGGGAYSKRFPSPLPTSSVVASGSVDIIAPEPLFKKGGRLTYSVC
jgi:hypothetical protein